MRANRTADRRRRGRVLVAAGLGQLVVYGGLVWFGIFGHDGGVPACFGPHSDVFFPPSVTCTPVGSAPYRVTSLLASGAGAVLFLIAVSFLVTGLLVLLRGRRLALPVRRPEIVVPAPRTELAAEEASS